MKTKEIKPGYYYVARFKSGSIAFPWIIVKVYQSPVTKEMCVFVPGNEENWPMKDFTFKRRVRL